MKPNQLEIKIEQGRLASRIICDNPCDHKGDYYVCYSVFYEGCKEYNTHSRGGSGTNERGF